MTFGIFPARLAEMKKSSAGKKYRPSNGTEGGFFGAAWCQRCERSGVAGCEIVHLTMCFDVEDDEYPVEWQIGQDGQPCCTAFVPVGQRLPEPRCTATQDMFGEAVGAA